MADQITYADKEQGAPSSYPTNQTWAAVDANEVKAVVNQHATAIDALEDLPKIEELETDQTNESYVIKPNGVGGVEWGVPYYRTGILDYNDSTGAVTLTADTWTDIPNDGQGAFSNFNYKPNGVTDVMDVSTGYLDFSELTLGSELSIRNDFTVTPATNNALLQVRYLLGQGAGEYPLLFWSERLDNGSGIPYQRVPLFKIYMGDTNTQGGVGKLQIKLSTNGVLNNAGSYISITLR